jgi:hypothetical protein
VVRARILFAVATALALVACSNVLGLGDLGDRDPGAVQDGTDPADAASQLPNGGKACVFDQSHFDDGCVFAP